MKEREREREREKVVNVSNVRHREMASHDAHQDVDVSTGDRPVLDYQVLEHKSAGRKGRK